MGLRESQGCMGTITCKKIGYDTERDAIGARLRNASWFKTDFRVYQCNKCSKWHLTSRLLPWQMSINVSDMHIPIDQWEYLNEQ